MSVAADDLKFPNGTVITPDGRTMILAETLGLRLTAFDIDSDGSLHNRRIWADLGARAARRHLPRRRHATSGWPTRSSRCASWWPRAAASSTRSTPSSPCFACMLGGPHRRHLFMLTAAQLGRRRRLQERTGRVLVAEVQVPGAGRP